MTSLGKDASLIFLEMVYNKKADDKLIGFLNKQILLLRELNFLFCFLSIFKY